MGKHNFILLIILIITTVICFTVGLWFLGLVLLLITIIFLLYHASNKWVEKQKKEEAKKLSLMQANRSLQIIENSKDIINKSKNFSTIQSRFDVIFENIEKLKELAQLYPDITKPTPQEIEVFYRNEKETFISNFILEEVENIYKKATELSGVKTKINKINQAIVMIIDGKKELEKEESIDKLTNKEKELKLYVQKIQLDEFLDKAKKAEFMGKKAKAIDAYKEALYFLKTDKIDDELQQNEIKEIEEKIDKLSD